MPAIDLTAIFQQSYIFHGLVMDRHTDKKTIGRPNTL